MNDKEFVKKCKEHYKEVVWHFRVLKHIRKNYWKMYRDILWDEREKLLIKSYVRPHRGGGISSVVQKAGYLALDKEKSV